MYGSRRHEDHPPIFGLRRSPEWKTMILCRPASPFRYQLVHVMKSLNGRKAFHLNVRGTEVAGLGYDR